MKPRMRLKKRYSKTYKLGSRLPKANRKTETY